MGKLILKVVIITLICAVLIVGLNFLLENKDGKYIYRMMNEMYDSEENIDTLFLGSSHVYRSYDPEIADEILGVHTFNAGTSAQTMNGSYYLLREICKYHDVKKVYLDTYCGMSHEEGGDTSVYILSDHMRPGINKTAFLWSYDGFQSFVDGYVTLRRNFTAENMNIVRNVKSHFSPISDYSSVTYDNEEYRGRGFVFSKITIATNEKDTFKDKIEVKNDDLASDFYVEYLDKIIDLCKEKGIELIFVEQPLPEGAIKRDENAENYLITNYDAFSGFIQDIADKNGIEYRNFNYLKDSYKSRLALTDDDFCDETHLNGTGAEKYTELFCNIDKELAGGTSFGDVFDSVK